MLRHALLLVVSVLSFSSRLASEPAVAETTRSAGEISVKGERVCVPAIPDESGRVRLDCAIGLRGDDDNFYGLRLVDPSRSQPFPTINERVLVRGQFIPGSHGAYGIVGDIVYTSIEPIDDPKVIVGELLCIEERGSSGEHCSPIIGTDRGQFWGLESRTSETSPDLSLLSPSTRVKAEGTVMRNMPERWHAWAMMGAPRRIEGVLEVERIEVLR